MATIKDIFLSSNVMFVDGTRGLTQDWDAGLSAGRKISVGKVRVAAGSESAPAVALGADNTGFYSVDFVSMRAVVAGTNVGYWYNEGVGARGFYVVGDATVSAKLTVAGQFIGVGTTDLVSNLNADLLDGQHGSHYLYLANATGTLDPTTQLATGSGAVTLAAGGTNSVLIPKARIGTSVPSGFSIYAFMVSDANGGFILNRDGSDEAFFLLINNGDATTGGQIRGLTGGGLRAIYGGAGSVNTREGWRLTSTGTFAVGTAAPNANAILEASSTTKAFLPPRMTTTQRNNIPSPTAGMDVYDSTLGKRSIRTASAWEVVHSSAGGILTATASLDFPSIAAGATAELTIALTGVVSTATAIATPASGIEAGLVWSAYAGTDIITVRIHNTTGSPIDPASRTWRGTAIKF